MLLSVGLSTVAFLLCSRQEEIKIDLYDGSACIGNGTYKEVLKGGKRTSTFDVRGSNEDGGTVHLIQIKTIDSEGYPEDESQTKTYRKGRARSTTISKVQYDRTGAAILDVSIDGAKSTIRSFVPPSGYSRADESDLWFHSMRPRPGTTVTSTKFSIDKPGWQKVETTYVKKDWIIVNGHSIEAYEVIDVRDGASRKVYLDDTGMPVLMTDGSHSTKKHFER